jgi:hypothetical protein
MSVTTGAATIVLGRGQPESRVSRVHLPEIRRLMRDFSHPPETSVAFGLPRSRAEITQMEGVMTYVNALRGVVAFLEHALAVLVGFVLMVLGLGLGVTMIMLPVGVVLGLAGVACYHDVDLIVMGTHGRGFVGHALMGSVAEKVVRTAPCPVLSVQTKQHEFVMPDAVKTTDRLPA